MQVEAYQCDFCKSILIAEQITGITNQPDLFETNRSFPSVKPEKTNFHFCLDCYRANVELHVKNKMNFREGEKYSEEREKLKFQLHNDFFFIFKKEVIRRHLAALKK